MCTAASTFERDMEAATVDALAEDLVAFARRARPAQGASRACDQRSEPHLWVIGVPDDATLSKLAARDDDRPGEIEFAVRFEIESPPYGLCHGCIDGYLDIAVLTGDDEPWNRAIVSEPDDVIGPVDDMSLYGPDYDAVDRIIKFVHGICTVLSQLDDERRERALAVLAAARPSRTPQRHRTELFT